MHTWTPSILDIKQKHARINSLDPTTIKPEVVIFVLRQLSRAKSSRETAKATTQILFSGQESRSSRTVAIPLIALKNAAFFTAEGDK